MNFINPPSKAPQGITHKTFFSQILNHEIGYNIYLPSDYDESEEKYPVVYHIHGWMGNESSEIWALEKAYRSRQAITIFVNAISSEGSYYDALLQIESIIIKELIPHIEGQYRINAARENRMISGFSMGGAFAFYYAVKNPELFGSVTPYAGTYHHQYHKDYHGVGELSEKAAEFYDAMIREKKYFEENGILFLLKQNADKLRGKLYIDIRIGTDDILICDNEILHMYLDSLNIPHEYKRYEGVAHELENILATVLSRVAFDKRIND